MRFLRLYSLAAVLGLAIVSTGPSLARAGDETGWGGNWEVRGQEIVTTAALYASLYVTVFIMVQTLRVTASLAVPAAYVATAQTFGVPAVMVAVMPHLIPAVRRSVPPVVERLWRGDSARIRG